MIKGVIYFMGKGKDNIAKSLLELEPGSMIDLFMVYPDVINSPSSVFAMHDGSLFRKGVVWQGKTYMPIGIEMEGFEIGADGKINRPRIKISNKDNFITTMLLKYDDFQNARIERRRTFIKFLDDVNFDGGNPFGESDTSAEISNQVYVVSQKTQENKIFVELELTSPLDLETFEINHRKIMGKYCYWKYRGEGCRYAGLPIQKEDGRPFADVNGDQIPISTFEQPELLNEFDERKEYTTGDVVFLRNDRVRINVRNGLGEPIPLTNYYVAKTNSVGLNPEKHPDFWDKDGCNKKISSCKLRFTSDQAVTRFVGTEEVERLTTRIDSNNGTAYGNCHFEPKNSTRYLQTLSGDGEWTMIFNFTRNPALSSKGQSMYLTTNPTVYEGLEFTHYERTDTDYYYYRQSGNSYNRYFGAKPDSEPAVDGQQGFKFVVRRNAEGKLQWYNPYNKKSIEGYIMKTPILDYFRLFATDLDSNWNTTYTRNARFIAYLENVCMWDRYVFNDEIDLLYRKLNNGALRAKPYNEIVGSEEELVKGLATNGLLGWWDRPYIVDGETGIRDRSNYKQDLIYNGTNNGGGDYRLLYRYIYSLNERVSSIEELSFLPFGGFPGTDGFGFQRPN